MMNDLDDRIRDLVARVVSGAPATPELTRARTAAATARNPSRRWPAIALVGACAAGLIGLVVLRRDEPVHRIRSASVSTDSVSSEPADAATVTVTVTPQVDETLPEPPPTPPASPSVNLPDYVGWLTLTAEGLVSTGGADPSDPIPTRPLVAFHDPRGGIIYQESVNGPVLRWRSSGALPEDMFAAVDFIGAIQVRDTAVVNGVQSLLYSLDINCGAPDTCESRLYLAPLEGSGPTQDLGVIGGWESDTIVNISDTGVLVGWERASADLRPFFVTLDDVELPFAADRNLDSWYTYCLGGSPCPRQFTIADDGSTVVWINDGGDLVVAAIDGAPSDDRFIEGDLGHYADIVDVRGGFALVRDGEQSWVVDLGSVTTAQWGEVAGRVLQFTPWESGR